MLRAALDYAARGLPVFPLKPGGKEPAIPKQEGGRGHLDATTDRSKITAWWNRWPHANIGIPTGERSGILALDVDQRAGLEALEAECGQLPATRTHSTGREAGGMHYLFTYPAGENIRNSTGKLAEGLDIRGEGGYIVAPPSATTRPYKVLAPAPLAETPEWLLEALRQRQSTPESRSHRTGGAHDPRSPSFATIEVGRRNEKLFFAALEHKDDSHEHGEVLAYALLINETLCEEPLPCAEVETLVASAMRYPKRRRGRKTPPEVLEIVEELERRWWATAWRGVGGKTERDIIRVLIALAKRYGEMIPSGVRVSVSVRTLALLAATHYTTVIRVINRMRSGDRVNPWLRRDADPDGPDTHSGAVVLLAAKPTRQGATTPGHSLQPPPEMPESGSSWSRPSLQDLETPCFRWRGHVRKGRAGVLYALEGFGPQTSAEIAERLGWSRVRDLRRKYLDPLEALGLVERTGDRYALPDADCYRQTVETTLCAPVVSKARRTSAEGRAVSVVVDGPSEREREAADREKHEEQRRRREEDRRQYRSRLRPVPDQEPEEEPDGEIRELERVEVALSEPDRLTLEAIEAFERKYGPGSFGWDRASCKALFYSGPISGCWPEPDDLRRIRDYVEVRGMAA